MKLSLEAMNSDAGEKWVDSQNRVDESSIIVYNAREAMETNHKEDAYAPGEERCENPEREACIPCL